MAKTAKRKSRKKPGKRKVVRKSTHKEHEPEYMVQINDPKNTRKSILESLREVIIFMQSYEKFKKIQEEKVATFAKLKTSVREINNLIEKEIKGYFPKGKLIVVSPPEEGKKAKEEAPKVEESPAPEVAPPIKVKKTKSELDELESQLKDIEGQLRTMN
jgi:hypothetical protein